MDERDFTKICFHLELPKVTARKQACEELNEFLLQKETISFLNSKTESWKKLYNALVKCMNTVSLRVVYFSCHYCISIGPSKMC